MGIQIFNKKLYWYFGFLIIDLWEFLGILDKSTWSDVFVLQKIYLYQWLVYS